MIIGVKNEFILSRCIHTTLVVVNIDTLLLSSKYSMRYVDSFIVYILRYVYCFGFKLSIIYVKEVG